MAESEDPDEPKYCCSECDWTGNDYNLIEEGVTYDRAVCGSEGDCTGGIRLNRTPSSD